MSKKLVSLKEAKRLIGEGRVPEGMAIMDALTREAARAATRNLLPSSIAGHLTEEARARYQGRTFVDVVQDLVKRPALDVGGTGVVTAWTGRLQKAGVPPEAAKALADELVGAVRKRAVEERELLAWALVELEVRHAEALKLDPAEYARPIRVVAPAEEPAELVNADERESSPPDADGSDDEEAAQ